ncbi:MAG: 16S rRNA (guanine(527)-N(7))-methyltransferase RsmG [Candidatus Babeliales bacterium]
MESQFSILVRERALTEHQKALFERYMHLLLEWNKKHNITAYETEEDIVEYHFRDSLALALINDPIMMKNKTIVDVGSGGGFPGIPLKIYYPFLRLVLIEVNEKKRSFLHLVVKELGLDNVVIEGADWRSFLRHSVGKTIDYVVARASLSLPELLRVFKPSYQHQHTIVVYWASIQWTASSLMEKYVLTVYPYALTHVRRKLVCFELKNDD